MKNILEYPSITFTIKTGCGSMYVHLLYNDKERSKIHSIKATLGKSGGCARSHIEVELALINALILNVPNSIAIKALTDACGHKCNNIEDTCHDLLVRMIIDILMKEKP